MLYRDGKTIKSYLGELYERYGYFQVSPHPSNKVSTRNGQTDDLVQTSNSYFICTDPPTVEKIFARIRNWDGKADASLLFSVPGISYLS
jgi:hypothetical protein